mmetsp:Transcript_3722/g.7685  ORF Transcript_3722/g.7685 Transcript_3722/m.7685 type:complete len:302 (-) Transcript_3722:265-1170(-)
MSSLFACRATPAVAQTVVCNSGVPSSSCKRTKASYANKIAGGRTKIAIRRGPDRFSSNNLVWTAKRRASVNARGTSEGGVSDVVDEKDASPLPDSAGKTRDRKVALLRILVSLDRGAAATAADREKVEEAASALEKLYPDVADSETPIDIQINGKWRLVYSSTFAGQTGGTQGFAGTPTGGSPLQLGQVYQRVQAGKGKLDNIVEISTPTIGPLPVVTTTATLSHTLNVLGPRTVQIVFDDLTVRVGGALRGVRPLTTPQLPEGLRPPAELRGGTFDVTFIHEDMRISRGDRGELRVFVKA